MKTQFYSALRIPHSALLLALLSTLNPQLSTAHAQGTLFTYQGRLTAGGNPANGSYDLTFTLFDAAVGGTLLSGPLANPGVGVSNGLFTVMLDFGAQFPGASRWLEIAVRTNGSGSYATFASRQQLTPAPYAITAGNVAPGGGLAGTYSGAVTLNNPANSFAGNGGSLSNVNAATLGGQAATAFWNINGNGGTAPPGNFLGTADNQPLELHVNGTRVLRLEPGNGGLPNLIGGAANNAVLPGSGGATIGGGDQITAGYAATVGGGHLNTASGYGAFVGGGGFDGGISAGNRAAGGAATVGGGVGNAALNSWTTVAGGYFNTNSGAGATIAGGAYNTASGPGSFVGGGGYEGTTLSSTLGNSASGIASAIGGGLANTNSGSYATIGGGWGNSASGPGSFIGGGGFGGMGPAGNSAGGAACTIGGGLQNVANGAAAAILGGQLNQASNGFATVAGGFGNIASGAGSFIGGGGYGGGAYAGNMASGGASTIGGGWGNTNNGGYATIGGGTENQILASGGDGAIGGGRQNTVSGSYATVPGGFQNTAAGNASFAAGQNAIANYNHSFVWGDGSTSASDNAPNQFQVLATGGVGLYTGSANVNIVSSGALTFGSSTRQMIDLYGTSYAIGVQPYRTYFRADASGGFAWFLGGSHSDTTDFPGSGGTEVMKLVAGGLYVNGSMSFTSDRNLKENFSAVNPRAVLEKVSALPIQNWNYKADAATRHIGPMAQDFYGAFGVGPDDRHITTVDEGGVALAAIQGLNEKLEARSQELEARSKKLEAENAELRGRLERVEQLLTGKTGVGK